MFIWSRHSYKLPLVLFAVCILNSMLLETVEAADPEATLKMCLRDGRNQLRRARRALQASDLGRAERALGAMERGCINGSAGQLIKGLSGYREVQRIYRETKGMVDNALKRNAAANHGWTKAAVDTGPGGDKKTVENRWKSRPDVCGGSAEYRRFVAAQAQRRSTGGYSRTRGYSRRSRRRQRTMRSSRGSGNNSGNRSDDKRNKRTARISGLDALNSGEKTKEIATKAVLSELDGLVKKMSCGQKVEGIDPHFNENKDINGGYINITDVRAKFGRAVLSGKGDADQRVLYKAALLHACFGATNWNPITYYAPYLFCEELVHGFDMSTFQRVVARKYRGSKFQIDNLMYIVKRGLKAKKELASVIHKVEARFPLMKQLYRDSPNKARAIYAHRLKKYVCASSEEICRYPCRLETVYKAAMRRC